MIKKRRIIDPIKIVWLIRLQADDTSNEAGALQLGKEFSAKQKAYCHPSLVQSRPTNDEQVLLQTNESISLRNWF